MLEKSKPRTIKKTRAWTIQHGIAIRKNKVIERKHLATSGDCENILRPQMIRAFVWVFKSPTWFFKFWPFRHLVPQSDRCTVSWGPVANFEPKMGTQYFLTAPTAGIFYIHYSGKLGAKIIVKLRVIVYIRKWEPSIFPRIARWCPRWGPCEVPVRSWWRPCGVLVGS